MKILSITIITLLISVCWFKASYSENVYKFKIKNEPNLQESDTICPNKRTKCKETQTCCKTKHNSYHCCRYENAECCPDHFHCCPEGSTCDTERNRCTNNVNFLALIPSKPRNNVMEWKVEKDDDKVTETCPNKRTKCKDTQTCCITKLGHYHCCKYPNAVCCSDKYHCCPSDTTCDLKRKKCNRNGIHPMLQLSKPLNVLSPSTKGLDNDNLLYEPIGSDITCPNNKTKCKDTKTCCITKHGNYYCCPHKNAICCSDKWLCCPEGATCDVENKKCLNSAISSYINNRERENEYNSNKELNMAGCCSDPKNCCNDGLICDNINKQCILSVEDQNTKMKSIEDSNGMWSLENSNMNALQTEVTCPNNKTTCKDTKTCCITKHGNYYCCPHKNAVCCSDKWSCCPESSTCDVKNKKCNTFSKSPLITAKKLISMNDGSVNIKISLAFFINLNKNCGNSNISCPSNGKCCSMKDGKYGCCSYINGLCCSDSITCCPQNTNCDVKNKICIPKINKDILSQNNTKLKTDICPDNKSECYSWQTCCPIGNGNYGCCTEQNATCCADNVSCCPHNSKCDLKNHQCIQKDIQLSVNRILLRNAKVMERIPLHIFIIKLYSGKIICGENYSFCPISDGKYGCCSYKSGECCSDMTSCCPSGTKCTTSGCSLI